MVSCDLVLTLAVILYLLTLLQTAPITSNPLTMAHGEPELVGMAKHFNSFTFTGRANVAKVK